MTLLPTNFILRKQQKYLLAAVLDFILICIILFTGGPVFRKAVDPLVSPLMPLKPLTQNKGTSQVFGFAPYWNINKLDNVDFKILTTLSYFGVEINSDGNLDKNSVGYETFNSSKATEIFKKAHLYGTKVVLTLTQMNNGNIESMLSDQTAQNRTIDQAVAMVKKRGIDGLNIDMEYAGDPGQQYRDKFSSFAKNITERMHSEVPNSQVTVSMYASSVKEPKIYDVAALGQSTDGIFMMAYDFAVAGSDNAIPTSPLYGHQSGKYWYDVSTAVNDFLTLIPASKLILGVPYYGYNYVVYEPTVKAETRPYYSWRGKPYAQTYTSYQENLNDTPEDVDQVVDGWDNDGQVGYKAYHIASSDTWRMVFMEDKKSLGMKYDFAKQKNLAGVGMWALGNDDGKKELWDLLEEKFGASRFADSTISNRKVTEISD